VGRNRGIPFLFGQKVRRLQEEGSNTVRHAIHLTVQSGRLLYASFNLPQIGGVYGKRLRAQFRRQASQTGFVSARQEQIRAFFCKSATKRRTHASIRSEHYIRTAHVSMSLKP